MAWGRHGQPPLLERIAQHEQIGPDGVAQDTRGQRARVDHFALRTDAGDERVAHCARHHVVALFEDEGRGGRGIGVDHPSGDTCCGNARATSGAPPPRGRIRAAGRRRRRKPHGVQIGCLPCDAYMARHGTVLLRHASEIERRAGLALEMRGHAEKRADGEHAGAADARDEDAVGLRERTVSAGSGNVRGSIAPSGFLRGVPPLTVTKLGQKPFRHE